ncbi:hypothetical protein WJ74_17970 [Burkholderia ubonensis]|nr:hypothetical protein WJ74_17970 [Burkholderia ubonensis]
MYYAVVSQIVLLADHTHSHTGRPKLSYGMNKISKKMNDFVAFGLHDDFAFAADVQNQVSSDDVARNVYI